MLFWAMTDKIEESRLFRINLPLVCIGNLTFSVNYKATNNKIIDLKLHNFKWFLFCNYRRCIAVVEAEYDQIIVIY